MLHKSDFDAIVKMVHENSEVRTNYTVEHKATLIQAIIAANSQDKIAAAIKDFTQMLNHKKLS